MKKILKSRIFLVILTAVICITGTAYASTLFASNITYDNTTSGLKDANDQDVTTVQGAIDALYNFTNNAIDKIKLGSAIHGNGEGHEYVTFNLTNNYYYLCSINTRGTTSGYTVDGANVIYGMGNGWMLDSRYSTYRFIIKVTQAQTTITFNDISTQNTGIGTGGTCNRIYIDY